MSKHKPVLCVTFIALFSLLSLALALKGNGRPISIQGHTIHTLTHQPKLSASSSRTALDSSLNQLYVVHIDEGLSSEHKALIERVLGVRLVHYVPNNAFIVSIASSLALHLNDNLEGLQKLGVLWISELESEHKISVVMSETLNTLAAGGEAARNKGKGKSKKESSSDSAFNLVAVLPFESDLLYMPQLFMAQMKEDLSITDEQVKIIVPYYERTGKHAAEILEVFIPANNTRLTANVAKWLAQRPNVAKVEHLPEIRTHNNAARWVTQSGQANDFSVYNQGLHGENQIIGCADTGIDFDHCFFNDPEQTVTSGVINMQHRKVVLYDVWSYAQFGDYVDGHGTHVTGTIAGETLYSDPAIESVVGRYNGVAYKAKLAFTGIGTATQSLIAPNDLSASGFFDNTLKVGARIHSNSWGCSSKNAYICNTYNTQARSLDRVIWENQELLVIFAAGNSGPDRNTVGAPATSKNCLTVGASQNSNQYSWKYVSYFTDIDNLIDEVCAQYTEIICPVLQNCCTKTAAFCCSLGVADCCGAQSNWDYGSYNIENLAEFSSHGPATYSTSRIKPDVIAPGSKIVSSHSDGDLHTYQCSNIAPSEGNQAALLAMEGTSMATPHVAGLAALVRQYFTEGFYPTGSRNVSNAVTPTSALLKAMLIISANDLVGRYQNSGYWYDVPASPSYAQGFGRIQLDSALFFANTSNFSLKVYDNVTIADSETHLYSLPVPRNKRVKIVMVYHDYPSLFDGSLVNNLDLSVSTPDGTTYWGNGAEGGDSDNNVERVVVPADPFTSGGNWNITVNATRVVYGPQRYSLVAVISNAYVSPSEPPRPQPSYAPPYTPTYTPPYIPTYNPTYPPDPPYYNNELSAGAIFGIVFACCFVIGLAGSAVVYRRRRRVYAQL